MRVCVLLLPARGHYAGKANSPIEHPAKCPASAPPDNNRSTHSKYSQHLPPHLAIRVKTIQGLFGPVERISPLAQPAPPAQLVCDPHRRLLATAARGGIPAAASASAVRGFLAALGSPAQLALALLKKGRAGQGRAGQSPSRLRPSGSFGSPAMRPPPLTTLRVLPLTPTLHRFCRPSPVLRRRKSFAGLVSPQCMQGFSATGACAGSCRADAPAPAPANAAALPAPPGCCWGPADATAYLPLHALQQRWRRDSRGEEHSGANTPGAAPGSLALQLHRLPGAT